MDPGTGLGQGLQCRLPAAMARQPATRGPERARWTEIRVRNLLSAFRAERRDVGTTAVNFRDSTRSWGTTRPTTSRSPSGPTRPCLRTAGPRQSPCFPPLSTRSTPGCRCRRRRPQGEPGDAVVVRHESPPRAGHFEVEVVDCQYCGGHDCLPSRSSGRFAATYRLNAHHARLQAVLIAQPLPERLVARPSLRRSLARRRRRVSRGTRRGSRSRRYAPILKPPAATALRRPRLPATAPRSMAPSHAGAADHAARLAVSPTSSVQQTLTESKLSTEQLFQAWVCHSPRRGVLVSRIQPCPDP